jgi:trehalose synthase
MLELVDVGERSLASYRGVAPGELLDAVEQAAAALRGARIPCVA